MPASPDGRWIVYTASALGGGGGGVYSGGGTYVQPYPGPGLRKQVTSRGNYPVWRKDGREIVYLDEYQGRHAVSQTQSKATLHTQIVLLGTGTPLPDPERAGPSTAIVVNSTPYIVDAGTGLVRRAAGAHDKGVVALRATNLKIALLTHPHSDHTLGLPDLMITPWIMGRKEPLELYGPAGTQEMVNHIIEAYEVDRKIRTEGLEHSNNTWPFCAWVSSSACSRRRRWRCCRR